MLHIGTSGFKFPEWKGIFYPEKIKPEEMLPFYAEHFNTTEVNYSFYRMPTPKLLSGWREEVSPNFKFSFKALRRITHDAQLKNCGELTDAFLDACQTLEGQLGVVLFQLAPTVKKDLSVVEEFLRGLPPLVRTAFEFRHASWFSDDVFAAMKTANVALCIADSDKLSTPTVTTADFSYFRLRKENYEAKDLEHWSEEIAKCPGDAFIYFKHEGTGVNVAQQFQQLELVKH